MEQKLMNVADAVIYTGLSRPTLYRLIQERQIKHYKPGGRLIFFEQEEIDRWLLKNPIAAITDGEKEIVN